MNYTGKQIKDAIVRRLNDENIRCYDSAIVAKLVELNRYELNQLVEFGEIDRWLSERKQNTNKVSYGKK